MRELLVVVDFQNSFADGKLGQNVQYLLEERICRCIRKYVDNKNDIVFTLDNAGDDNAEKLFGRTGRYYGKAAAVFRKGTYGSLELGKWLEGKKYGKIEICGLVTDMCVLANAVIAQAACPDAEIVIDSNLTGTYNNELGIKALGVMQGLKMRVIQEDGKFAD